MEAQTPQPEMLGATLGDPQINVGWLCYVLNQQVAQVCPNVAISVSTNGSGGYQASYDMSGQGAQTYWQADPAAPDIVAQMYYNTSAFDSAEQAGVNSLNGTMSYTFGANVAVSDFAITVSLGIVLNVSYSMHFFGIDATTTSTDVVHLSGTFIYPCSQNEGDGIGVGPTRPMMSETGTVAGGSGTNPCPVTADQTAAFQQAAYNAMLAAGTGLEIGFGQVLNGINPITGGGDPFGPGFGPGGGPGFGGGL